jgi:hypothetical protein
MSLRTFLTMALVGGCLSSLLFRTASAAEAPGCNLVHVPVINEIKLTYDGTKSIKIDVTGTVPTTGYTNISLVRRVYVVPPADGVWEYDMFACKPTGIVAQVLTAVAASDKWESPPKSLKGIRVYGSAEHKEVPVEWPKK